MHEMIGPLLMAKLNGAIQVLYRRYSWQEWCREIFECGQIEVARARIRELRDLGNEATLGC